MKHCLSLAEKALKNGNPPVGAILEFDGNIIGEGIESGKSTNDITNHAEIEAIRDAIKKGFIDQLQSATMYTTHEPCIMCSYVIRHHKILEIVYGSSVDHIGGYSSNFAVLSNKTVPNWGTPPKVVTGICEKESNYLSSLFKELNR